MNIITKAVDTIKFNIPIEILRIAFKDSIYNHNRAPISLDENILNQLVRPRVLVDSNLVGGDTVIIPLDGLNYRVIDNYSVVYEIPSDVINHRNILSVLSIGYLSRIGGTGYSHGNHTGSSNCSGSNDLLNAAMRVGSSMAGIPNVSTARADLVGNNTVVVYDQSGITGLYELRCIVANEANLGNISPRSYLPFSNLCLHAAKSYIYNRLIVAIDSAYISGGQELGAIKNIIESYSDAEENYQTYLNEKWRPTAFMNDTPSYDRFIKMQISPGL